MALPAATALAATIFSCFSPTKSPFYTVVSFGALGLALAVEVEANFDLVFTPICAVLLVSTGLAFRNAPDFSAEEYNSQIKFARSFGISAAILCLVFLAREVEPVTPEGNGAPENHWWFWAGYAAALAQAAIFLFYIFIYHDYEARQRGVNGIQMSLIISTYLIAATYVSVEHYRDAGEHAPNSVLIAFYVLWALCALFMLVYLLRNFRLAMPADAAPLGSALAADGSAEAITDSVGQT